MGLISNPLLRRPLQNSSSPAAIGIAVLWLIVNGFLLLKNGIYTSGEAGKYIYEATYLANNGHLRSHNFLFYSVLIYLLAASIKFHLGFGWIIALQAGFALAATLSFHKTLLFLRISHTVAFAATGLLLLNIPYQGLNRCLQTESLFHSLTLLLVCRLLQQKQYSGRFLLWIFVFLTFLSLVRPTGFLYWPLGAFYLGALALANRPPVVKIVAASVALIGMLAAINFAMDTGGDFDFSLPFREEHIICGVSTLLTPRSVPVTGSGNSLLSLAYFIFHDFGRFMRLAGLKTLSFWGVYRSYYSLPHNLYLAIYFYPITAMALFSIPRWIRGEYRLSFICLATPVMMTWATVVLTCDDWNNRFFLNISPFLLLLAAGNWLRPARPHAGAPHTN